MKLQEAIDNLPLSVVYVALTAGVSAAIIFVVWLAIQAAAFVVGAFDAVSVAAHAALSGDIEYTTATAFYAVVAGMCDNLTAAHLYSIAFLVIWLVFITQGRSVYTDCELKRVVVWHG